jgi:hypothetical protein
VGQEGHAHAGSSHAALPTQTERNQIVIAASSFDHCYDCFFATGPIQTQTVRVQTHIGILFRPHVPEFEIAVQAVVTLNLGPQEILPHP